MIKRTMKWVWESMLAVAEARQAKIRKSSYGMWY